VGLVVGVSGFSLDHAAAPVTAYCMPSYAALLPHELTMLRDDEHIADAA
jgi:hypothetical protein